MMDRRQIQRLAIILYILAGKLFPRFAFLADRLHNPHTGPDLIFTDRIVVQPGSVDRISPGTENSFCGGINAGMIRRVVMGIQRFFPVAGNDILLNHFRGPYSLKHIAQPYQNLLNYNALSQ